MSVGLFHRTPGTMTEWPQRFPVRFKSLSSKDLFCTGFVISSAVRSRVATSLLATICIAGFPPCTPRTGGITVIPARFTEQPDKLLELQLLAESEVTTHG